MTQHEGVSYQTPDKKKAFAIVEVGDYKRRKYMNGYEGRAYNILITSYPPNTGKLKELLSKKTNDIIYDKKKDASRGTSSRTGPSVSNDASFFEGTVSQDKSPVKGSDHNNGAINPSSAPDIRYQSRWKTKAQLEEERGEQGKDRASPDDMAAEPKAGNPP